MKKKPFMILGVTLLVLVGIAILSLWWLLLTRWGASFVVRRVVKDVIGAADYKITGMDGSIGGHLV
ncbi:MAG: hypothetical protein PHO59_00880, partial [Candidatus Omnitrophica bacterium]|nr:hypothetical protein [Candidatus Omnitrophota bacterium]